MNSKQDLLMISLSKYFSNKSKLNKFKDIINGKSDISLRVIDWFVTNYAKKHHIIYDLNKMKFMVYLEYKSQLKSYSKKQFDPFCRRERIHFKDHNGNIIETTVGQGQTRILPA